MKQRKYVCPSCGNVEGATQGTDLRCSKCNFAMDVVWREEGKNWDLREGVMVCDECGHYRCEICLDRCQLKKGAPPDCCECNGEKWSPIKTAEQTGEALYRYICPGCGKQNIATDYRGLKCSQCGFHDDKTVWHFVGGPDTALHDWACPVCSNIERANSPAGLKCSKCMFAQLDFSNESGLVGKEWSLSKEPLKFAEPEPEDLDLPCQKKPLTAEGECPICGEKGAEKTMAAMAAMVEKRLWAGLPEKIEVLLKDEFDRIDKMTEQTRNRVAKAGLIAVRASMKTKAVSKILAARTAKS